MKTDNEQEATLSTMIDLLSQVAVAVERQLTESANPDSVSQLRATDRIGNMPRGPFVGPDLVHTTSGSMSAYVSVAPAIQPSPSPIPVR